MFKSLVLPTSTWKLQSSYNRLHYETHLLASRLRIRLAVYSCTNLYIPYDTTLFSSRLRPGESSNDGFPTFYIVTRPSLPGACIYFSLPLYSIRFYQQMSVTSLWYSFPFEVIDVLNRRTSSSGNPNMVSSWTDPFQSGYNPEPKRSHLNELVIQSDPTDIEREFATPISDPDVEIPPFLQPEKVKERPHQDHTHTTDVSSPYTSGLGGGSGNNPASTSTSTIIISCIVAGSILALGALFWAFKIWRLRRAIDDDGHGGQRKGDVALQEKFKNGWKKATRRRRNSTWFDCPTSLHRSHPLDGEAYSVIGSSSYASTKFLIHDPEKAQSTVAPTLYQGSPERIRPDSNLSSIPSHEKGFGPPMEVGYVYRSYAQNSLQRMTSPTSIYSQPSIPAGLSQPISPLIIRPSTGETRLYPAYPGSLTLTTRPVTHDNRGTKPLKQDSNHHDPNYDINHERLERLIPTTSLVSIKTLGSNTSPRFSSASVTESIIQDAIYHQNSPQPKSKSPPRSSSQDGSQLSSSFEYDSNPSAMRTPRRERDDGHVKTVVPSQSAVSFTAPSSPERVLLPAPEHMPRSKRMNEMTTPPRRKPVRSILKSETRNRNNSSSEQTMPTRSSDDHGSRIQRNKANRKDLLMDSFDRHDAGSHQDSDREVVLPCEPERVLCDKASTASGLGQGRQARTAPPDVSQGPIRDQITSVNPIQTDRRMNFHLPTGRVISSVRNVDVSGNSPSGAGEGKDLESLLTAMGIAGPAPSGRI